MATVRRSVSGLDAIRARLAGLPGELHAAASDGLAAVAEAAVDTARASLRQGPGRSAPGDPPADPDGLLAASMGMVRDPDTAPGRASARISSAAPEAAFLEYGTARMAARPFLRPAARAAARGARTLFAAALRKGLRP